MRERRWTRTTIGTIIGIVLLWCVGAPGMVSAQDDVELLKQRLEQMSQEMEAVQKKLEDIERNNQAKEEEIEEIDDRLNKTELHSATDKVSFGVELRTRADSLQYKDIQVAPSSFVGSFFVPPPNGFQGATLPQIQQAIGNMAAAGMIPPTEKYDATNDIILTNKFRLNMNAKVNDQLSFTGRLAAYKVFGDSTGVKVNQGNLGDVTLDGNTSSLPHGDTIRLERAYFNYKKDLGPVPTNFSLGRRPSTDGPPLEYLNNSLEGGSPLATIINWQFDGASYSVGLEEVTSIPGAAFKLCYGVGFEGDWGNTYSLGNQQADVDDVHMFGVIATLFDNDSTSAVLNWAHAWDITDGFTGLTVMPFIVSENANGEFTFEQNSGGFITRLEPTTEIGDWDALSLLLRTNLTERFDKDIDMFLSGSWSHTKPSQTSNNPFYKIMGQGLLNSMGELKDRDGYMIYLGAVFPMPWNARFGLEYNYGSQYWFNFTGAEDSLVGSKLAVRGSVYEGYWHQPIYGDNFFATLGVRYYDYEYTGSGNPMGEPMKIAELNSLNALNPVIDEVWDGYLSLTFRY
ncbi:DUF3373 family protein [Desulfosarcina sp.]|uniref:DUF3373 family protein n=1 Tax=Desulfosarcina sp. TaxID=2027861 RepID=UPI0029B23CCA|nr:DUF3373 family protein [Desulfosarcina sp.]MDX2454863.1 DUF3373 family protein [Desulfosarcina sp.]